MCGVVESALCGGRNGRLFCLCIASYSVATSGSAIRHETRKTAPLLHVKLQPVLYIKQPPSTIRKIATLCYT